MGFGACGPKSFLIPIKKPPPFLGEGFFIGLKKVCGVTDPTPRKLRQFDSMLAQPGFQSLELEIVRTIQTIEKAPGFGMCNV